MRKMKNSKGFTLMEMLIVVAIIAILVAIMIPVMTSQLERARETADLANLRAAYAEASVTALTDDTEGSKEVTMTQHTADFTHVTAPDYMTSVSSWGEVEDAINGTKVTVKVSADGVLSFEVK